MIELAKATETRDVTEMARRFEQVRSFTTTLCEPLSPEDCCIQSMPSASPTRWHLAHTSWFFETFVLKEVAGYQPFDEHYEVLFNSYYNSVGEQFPRARRGLLSRPSLEEVMAYRRHIDERVSERLAERNASSDARLATIMEWGVQHEQQHQELMLTDVKYLFSLNPLLPAYRQSKPAAAGSVAPHEWLEFPGGVHEIGHDGDGFAYDNESPRHRVYFDSFHLASRPVISGEFLEFIEDGAYARPEFWLSEGWNFVGAERLASPLYWFMRDGAWWEFTLAGPRLLDRAAPVTHISYFEADAYARWAGARLPTEAEWEVASDGAANGGHFVDALLAEGRPVHPASGAAATRGALQQMFGDVWEWTASPYVAYPGYQPPEGALGEYNGKFMCNQYVLRGGSCATSSTHIRRTYRNFFPPDARWQFSGIRLAR